MVVGVTVKEVSNGGFPPDPEPDFPAPQAVRLIKQNMMTTVDMVFNRDLRSRALLFLRFQCPGSALFRSKSSGSKTFRSAQGRQRCDQQLRVQVRVCRLEERREQELLRRSSTKSAAFSHSAIETCHCEREPTGRRGPCMVQYGPVPKWAGKIEMRTIPSMATTVHVSLWYRYCG
jgi:hypothetical protein